ncbi:hypothetical protein Sjap_026437 [Stephania japonica]|uniref:alpha-1,2-Mannosidase n=1 Tax=Stephania japonica TaxID=461633 RepID=A0AAP0HIW2_9MAGN
MSRVLPSSTRDVDYDNAKFRHRSLFKVITRASHGSSIKRDCLQCSTGKLLILLMIVGLACLILSRTSPIPSDRNSRVNKDTTNEEDKSHTGGAHGFRRFWRRPPRLPPRLTPDEKVKNDSLIKNLDDSEMLKWRTRQQKVKDAFLHAWSGYKNYAMGYDELMPLSRRGTDGLGGLGATVVDALDTAMIMDIDEIVLEAGTWIENNLQERIAKKGNGGEHGMVSAKFKGPKPDVYQKIAKDLADRLLVAFTSSPTPIPFSDVVLRDNSAHPAPDGLSSTAEVATLQLEFNYLSEISNDTKYRMEAMKRFDGVRRSNCDVLMGGEDDTWQTCENAGVHSHENAESWDAHVSRSGWQVNCCGDVAQADWRTWRDFQTEVLAVTCTAILSYFESEFRDACWIEGSNVLRLSFKVHVQLPLLELVCFLPGTLALGATKGCTKNEALKENLLSFEDLENLKLAEDLMKTCFEMYSVTSTGLAPEIAYFHVDEFTEDGLDGGNKSSEYVNDIIIKQADRHNLLRPETVESLFVLYRITEDKKYRDWGWQIFMAFEKYTRVDSGGYSSLDDVTMLPPHRRDKMETFFLGETLKYLYLLFGESTNIPLDKFIFSTEAHPFPINGALKNA